MLLIYPLLYFMCATVGDFSLLHSFCTMMGTEKLQLKSEHGRKRLLLSDFSPADYLDLYSEDASDGIVFKECVLLPEIERTAIEVVVDIELSESFLTDALTGLYNHGYSMYEALDLISFSGDRYAAIEANLIIVEDFEEDD